MPKKGSVCRLSPRHSEKEYADRETATALTDGVHARENSATGGDNIVHKEDMATGEFFRAAYIEYTPHVVSSFPASFEGLLGIVTRAGQIICYHRDAGHIVQGAGNYFRLVIAPYALTLGMQRHRDDKVNTLKEIGLHPFGSGFISQLIGYLRIGVVFEAFDELLQRSGLVVVKVSPATPEMLLTIELVFHEVVPPCSVIGTGKRTKALPADGLGEGLVLIRLGALPAYRAGTREKQ